MKKRLISVKECWDRNKGRIAVITTGTTVLMVMVARAQWKNFAAILEEHDLLEEYLTDIEE